MKERFGPCPKCEHDMRVVPNTSQIFCDRCKGWLYYTSFPYPTAYKRHAATLVAATKIVSKVLPR